MQANQHPECIRTVAVDTKVKTALVIKAETEVNTAVDSISSSGSGGSGGSATLTASSSATQIQLEITRWLSCFAVVIRGLLLPNPYQYGVPFVQPYGFPQQYALRPSRSPPTLLLPAPFLPKSRSPGTPSERKVWRRTFSFSKKAGEVAKLKAKIEEMEARKAEGPKTVKREEEERMRLATDGG
ncbi:MAG: hypothetical protein LQ350_004865 [Teloschistes chrysophthalmus]|nr:MAG: hypothetical protein LQ350_004865 [Niorma chrysophthalma]